MKRRNMDHYEYSLQHTQDRAFHRYDWNLTKANYDELLKLVQDDMVRSLFPKSTPHYKVVNQEGAQYTLIVPFHDRQLVVVFDLGHSLVTTLLPLSDFADHLHI